MINEVNYETFMQANKAVSACCSRFGLENAGFNERRRFDLKIDDRPVSFAFIESNPSVLWIGCEIGVIDRDNRDALAWLFRAGMQPWVLRGQRIGLLPGTSTALIYTVLHANQVAEDVLAPTVEALLDAAAEFGDQLARCDFTQRLH